MNFVKYLMMTGSIVLDNTHLKSRMFHAMMSQSCHSDMLSIAGIVWLSLKNDTDTSVSHTKNLYMLIHDLSSFSNFPISFPIPAPIFPQFSGYFN